eukprot:scaffold223646_cov23-Tisochrysis_lutea.AAC.2
MESYDNMQQKAQQIAWAALVLAALSGTLIALFAESWHAHRIERPFMEHSYSEQAGQQSIYAPRL